MSQSNIDTYTVRTYIDACLRIHQISERVNRHGQFQKIRHYILDTKEEQIRERLAMLGWDAPEVAREKDAEISRLKKILGEK